MTRMLLQLRRVVYLLVLLQCCACVVLANQEARAAGGRDGEESNKRMAENVANRLSLSVPRAYMEVEDGRACLKLWRERVAKCNASAVTTAAAANEIAELVREMAQIKETPGEDDSIKEEKLRAIGDVADKVSKTIDRTTVAVDATLTAIADADAVKVHCAHIYANIDDGLHELEQGLLASEEIEEKYRTSTLSVLVKNGTGIKKILSAMKGEYEGFGGDHQHSTLAAQGKANSAKRKAFEAGELLKEFQQKIDACRVELERDNAKTKVAQAVTKTGGVGIKPKASGITGDKFRVEFEEEKKREAKRKLDAILEKERDLRKAKENAERERAEQERLAAEKRAEQENRANEKAERARKAEEERTRREAEEKAKQEEARKAEEEKAQAAEEEKVSEEAGRKAKEEEAKRLAEESEKKAKEELEKAKKQKDGGSNPALLHVPLLLLLLCVLGCTLVC